MKYPLHTLRFQHLLNLAAETRQSNAPLIRDDKQNNANDLSVANAAMLTVKLAKTLYSSMASQAPKFEHLLLTRPSSFVVHVELNRPDKWNALNYKLWM